ncbi:hypothetical protein K504DRAFT_496729 [Pleomassaria siparia CBS 279.74]|uniref:Uncharacterized protein n=1 Tax=Pleomassaria siparia CBS 279.74 TaxID=1314801 RepID=A0A6G1KR73_9PLEO|nr:hypothetical protein K504DRAFT_496729 [Pleomassaria siparia CBS 279.74]
MSLVSTACAELLSCLLLLLLLLVVVGRLAAAIRVGRRPRRLGAHSIPGWPHTSKTQEVDHDMFHLARHRTVAASGFCTIVVQPAASPTCLWLQRKTQM